MAEWTDDWDEYQTRRNQERAADRALLAPAGDVKQKTQDKKRVRHRSRGWVWTYQLGGDLEEAIKTYEAKTVEWQAAWKDHWAMYRVEQCPQTGNYHVQGTCVWKTSKDFGVMNKLAPHFNEPCRGNIESNIAYVTKSETGILEAEEVGTRPASNGVSGTRTDLNGVKV